MKVLERSGERGMSRDRAMARRVLAAVALPIGAFGFLLPFLDRTLLAIGILSVAWVLSLWHLLAARGMSLRSPPSVISIGLAATGYLGALFFDRTARRAAVPAILHLSSQETRKTLVLFLAAALAVTMGAHLYSMSRVALRQFGPGPLQRDPEPIIRDLSSGTLLLVGTLPLLMIVLGTGIGPILSRSQYLPNRSQTSLSHIGLALSAPAVIIVAYLVRGAHHLTPRILAIGLIAAYGMINFAFATRALAGLPFLVYFGLSLSEKGVKRKVLSAAVALILTLLAFQLPLQLRSLHSHGLLPYSSYAIENGREFLVVRTQASVGNVLFSFPLAGHVAFQAPRLALSTFLVSVNPAPGFATSWYSISPSLKVNPYTPYDAIGELGNYGLGVLTGYFLVVGMAMSHCATVSERLPGRFRALASLGLLGVSGYFLVTCLQYNLRSTTRIVFYMLAIDFVARVSIRLRAAGPRPATTPHVGELQLSQTPRQPA